jgi:hypothetical protein
MSKQQREVVADWLIIGGALVLLASLFLTWSRQFSPAFLARYVGSDQLQGVPHDPTAWQVYSTADVLLALLAASLVGVALLGTRRARLAALTCVLIAAAVIVHALGTPPTNGATIFDPTQVPPGYVPNMPASGSGELVAVLGLAGAVLGLLLSFTAD